MRHTAYLWLALTACMLSHATAAQAEAPEDWISKGKVFGEIRYRYEHVEQDGLPQTGVANTVRANLGFETGTYKDLKALVELQAIRHIGDDDFNDTTNGKVTYPIIADPENSEFNQAWLMWSGIPKTSVKVGRQAIMLDNQRFVGTVGWRQNDQTYDAATIAIAPFDKASFSYNYIWNVNRIFGEHNAIPDFTGDTHLFHGEYAFGEWLKAVLYGYFVDIDETPALSSRSLGGQLTGKTPISDQLKFQYLVEYAQQREHTNNPVAYSVPYFHMTPSVLWNNWTFQMGFESLGGNGVSAFQTPLATLHAFNGWADKFLTTPATGLEDAYARVSYKVQDWHPLADGMTFDVVYHDFDSEDTSADYGDEWNFQAAKTFKTEAGFFKECTITVKHAVYNRDSMLTDTNKTWLMVGLKY